MNDVARMANRRSSGPNASASLFCNASKKARFQSLYWTFKNTSASVRKTTVPSTRRARQRSSDDFQYGPASAHARRVKVSVDASRANMTALTLLRRPLFAPLDTIERVLHVAQLVALDPIRPLLKEGPDVAQSRLFHHPPRSDIDRHRR